MLPEPYKEIDYRKPGMYFKNNDFIAFQCDTVGVSGTTPIYVQKSPATRDDGFKFKYVARMGFAVMGTANDPDCHKKSPFDDDWWDNYVEGKGYTLEVALNQLKEKLKSIQDGLWA